MFFDIFLMFLFDCSCVFVVFWRQRGSEETKRHPKSIQEPPNEANKDQKGAKRGQKSPKRAPRDSQERLRHQNRFKKKLS